MKKTFVKNSISVLLLLLISCKTHEKFLEVRNLGIFGKSRTKTIAGQDGCTPVQINKNIMMWTFGDTIHGSWKGPVNVSTTFEESATFSGMISNSIAFTQIPDDDNHHSLNFRFVTKKGRAVSFINPGAAEKKSGMKFWTIDGIKIGSRVYVYYIIVQVLKTGGGYPIWCFRNRTCILGHAGKLACWGQRGFQENRENIFRRGTHLW